MPANRLSVDIRPESYERFAKHFKHGLRGEVVRIIVDELILLCDRYGAGKVTGALIDRSLHLQDIIKIEEGNNDYSG